VGEAYNHMESSMWFTQTKKLFRIVHRSLFDVPKDIPEFLEMTKEELLNTINEDFAKIVNKQPTVETRSSCFLPSQTSPLSVTEEVNFELKKINPAKAVAQQQSLQTYYKIGM